MRRKLKEKLNLQFLIAFLQFNIEYLETHMYSLKKFKKKKKNKLVKKMKV